MPICPYALCLVPHAPCPCRYLEACTILGVRAYDLFVVVDLFENKNPDAVVKNILALAQLATESFEEWHGPTLPVGKGRVWEQPASWVSRGTSSVSLLGRISLDSSSPGTDRTSLPDSDAPPDVGRARISAALADADERSVVDVGGLDEESASRAWAAAALGMELDEATPLQAHLKSGVLLCNLINTLRPAVISRVHQSDRPFEHMENIGNYTKACARLGVSPTFDTPDLYEGKNMKVVCQNIAALERVARGLETYDGPLIARQTERMLI